MRFFAVLFFLVFTMAQVNYAFGSCENDISAMNHRFGADENGVQVPESATFCILKVSGPTDDTWGNTRFKANYSCLPDLQTTAIPDLDNTNLTSVSEDCLELFTRLGFVLIRSDFQSENLPTNNYVLTRTSKSSSLQNKNQPNRLGQRINIPLNGLIGRDGLSSY
jgi:hypothetical protein